MTRNEVEKGEILSELGFGREGVKVRVRVRVLVIKRRQAMNIKFPVCS